MQDRVFGGLGRGAHASLQREPAPAPARYAGGRPTADAIQRERTQLASVRARADMIIDTSTYAHLGAPGASLRREFSELTDQQLMDVQVFSFGFKHGLPVEARHHDRRALFAEPLLRPRDASAHGLDEKVSSFVLGHPKTKEFLDAWFRLLDAVMPGYVAEGKPRLSIAIGCTGGQHRSVAIAEATGHLSRAPAVPRGHIAPRSSPCQHDRQRRGALAAAIFGDREGSRGPFVTYRGLMRACCDPAIHVARPHVEFLL